MLAPVSDLTQAMIIKGRAKASLIVGKRDACISTKGKASALRPTVVHFPTILVFQCMFLKEEVKENVRDLVLLVLLLLQGGVGGTPLEDVKPLDAVHRLAEVIEGDLLTLRNIRLNLATISQRDPVPSGICVLSSIMADKQEQDMMICSPCVPSLAATKRVLSFQDAPGIIYVYISHMEYGSTHNHILRRARNTHEKIRMNKALPAYSSKPHKRSSAGKAWLDKAVSCLKKGPSHMNIRLNKWTQRGLKLLPARILIITALMRLTLITSQVSRGL